MFRILNADLQTSHRTVAGAAEPQVEFIKFDDGTKIAYDCNSMCSVLVGDMLWNLMKDKDSKDQRQFEGLLWSTRKPMFPFFQPQQINMMVLEATHACNLACKYCFVRHYYPDQTAKKIQLSQVQNAVKQLFSPMQQIDIGFFGGEPLMAWDAITEIMEWAEQEQLKRKREWQGKTRQMLVDHPKFHITTNATLMTKEKADYLAKKNCSFIVSLDGNELTHNSMRPAKAANANSYQMTMAGLKNMHEAGLSPRTTLRSSYTGQGVNLCERMFDLNNLMYKGWAGHVSIEPITLSESACIKISDEDTEGLAMSNDPEALTAQFRTEYRNAAKWYVNEINEGRAPSLHHFDKLLERLLYTIHSPTECGAGKGYAAVDPDGNIYACHREHGSKIGNLDIGIDEELRAPWLDNRLYNRVGCMKCPIRYVCGGSCRVDSILRNNDIHIPDSAGCWFKRVFFEECLWIMAHLTQEQLTSHVRNPKNQQRQMPPQMMQPRMPQQRRQDGS